MLASPDRRGLAADLKRDSKMSIETLHKINSPYSMSQYIEVYGDPEMAWYEWRITNDEGQVFQDTGTEHNHQGRLYGNPGIALRDALMGSLQKTEKIVR